MHIDLTDAAHAYGMSYVPRVVTDPKELLQAIIFGGDPVAAFDISTHTIHVWPDLLNDPEQYDESRFHAAGAPTLCGHDRARFILAHELWHARQDELYGDAAMFKDAAKSNVSTEAHDADFIEQDADKHAAQVYKLVKIGE